VHWLPLHARELAFVVEQRRSQLPQFRGSPVMARSQPSPAVVLQSPKPLAQVPGAQSPAPLQTGVVT